MFVYVVQLIFGVLTHLCEGATVGDCGERDVVESEGLGAQLISFQHERIVDVEEIGRGEC